MHNARLIKHNVYYNNLIIFAICYALIGANIKFWLFDKGADVVFDIFTIVIMVIFLFDFAVNIIAGNEYLISFYFWMDIASMILIVFDLSYVRERIFKNNTSVNKMFAYNFFLILEVF